MSLYHPLFVSRRHSISFADLSVFFVSSDIGSFSLEKVVMKLLIAKLVKK